MGKVQDNPRISAPQIADDLKADYKIEMTPQTVRNAITKAGYNGRAASKKDLCNGESASSLQRSMSDVRVMVWVTPNQHMLTKNLCGTLKHGVVCV
ncbi:hypothetical protein AVEN_163976-1 [Araneus ventricosus]|uniref:Transposase Tc1-like domain-containing protein n=1 Tax=Araneus ventricosus TaxID=182803 RepID=A0A4Y2PJ36_ARAVE|nr:hypothetical protein AVEN_1776-1 [Araneus ventricosus]GBN50076.1 hypothetical protein AVEN_163976-1 [Araneus ventricosus]